MTERDRPLPPGYAAAELIAMLGMASLDPDALDPWEAWKVFKRFLAREVPGVNDAAAFQCGLFEREDGSPAFYVLLVRQFSHRQAGVDTGVSRVVIELRYDPAHVAAREPTQVWTHDFASLAEFASVVEGREQFQAACNCRPDRTEVYGEEL